ncbi:MAG TPA: carboxypeptidase-like regulatory domain-containing protein [Saprospiraceae bacterium]|nr:carboxypeptidase-like regulatory domain-containing protein [Saprospiraceae bacterium]HMQ84218.1 carboxypeptidase-like regulatory domain-containing protein [Saprospiraceae bacterium]
MAQTIHGIVLDKTTKEALPFVHIGILNENRGVISDDQGLFEMDVSHLSTDKNIVFSMIGYHAISMSIREIQGNNLRIELEPRGYLLNEVVVKPAEVAGITKLGRHKLTKTTTGQSGVKKFGFGGEWGIRIKYKGQKYQIEDVNFHTRFNTVDSVLYRINIYTFEGDLPAGTILSHPVYVKSYAKDKWISKNVLSEQLIVQEDIIVAFELVQIWYNSKGENHLFYSMGQGYDAGKSYSRPSSQAPWEIDERGPIALYITARLLQ